MSKRHGIDTVILAAALFLTTGAVLFYNIKSSDGGSVSVSLSDLMEKDTSASLVSECAAAHLSKEKSVYTSAAADDSNPFDYLLPPILTPPTE